MNRTLDTLSSIFAPLCAIILLMFGQGFFLSFVSLHLKTRGGGDLEIGLVHAAYYAGMLLGAARAERLILKVGHIRAYAGYCSIGVACITMQGLMDNWIVWLLARFMIGYCLAVYYVVVESWFLGVSKEATRGMILSLYMMSLYISQASSQFILDWIDLGGADPFFYAMLLTALSAVPLTLIRSPSPQVHESSDYTLTALLKKSIFGVSSCLIGGMILSAIYSFLPLYAEGIGIAPSLLVFTCIMGGVLLQWPLGRLSDVFDRRKVLFGVACTILLPSSLLIGLDGQMSLTFPLVFALGGVAFTLYPLAITQVCDRLQPSDITKATSVLLLAYGIGAVSGPILSSLFLKMWPHYGLFLFLNACSLAAVGFGIQAFLARPSVPSEDQGDFVPLPTATPVAYELDPRGDTAYEEHGS